MLIDVVCMRRAGVKLSAAAIKAEAVTRGNLTMHTELWRELWAPNSPRVPTTFAYLRDHLEDDPIAPSLMSLREARVTTLRDAEFVIVGLERQGEQFREVDSPQAWWCRVVAIS